MAFAITEGCNGCGACGRICPMEAIAGEPKEVHRIDAVLCIDCGACGRICPQGAVLDGLGKACLMEKRSAWRKPLFDYGKCMSCTICLETCPANCLALSQRRGPVDPHTYPFLSDDKACIACGFCAVECPVGAVAMAASPQVGTG